MKMSRQLDKSLCMDIHRWPILDIYANAICVCQFLYFIMYVRTPAVAFVVPGLSNCLSYRRLFFAIHPTHLASTIHISFPISCRSSLSALVDTINIHNKH